MEENKNVFDDITPNEKLPASAKSEVMDRLAAAKLMLDFWDLFAQKRVDVGLNTLTQTQTKKIEE